MDNPIYLIIGAGRIGKAMHTLLSEQSKNVVMVDTVKEAIELRNNPTFVIAALPYNVCLDAAMWCAQKSIPVYIDFTEDSTVREKVHKLSQTYGNTCFIPCCGLAPGYVNIIAGRMIRSLEYVESVKIYCGALPLNKIEDYKISWNVEGLINLYLNPCDIIYNKKKISAFPLTGLEELTIAGTTYEAALTSGGLGTMIDADKLPTNMFYKTLRYPGHFKMVEMLVKKFKLGKEELIKMFKELPAVVNDKVVIRIEVVGSRHPMGSVNTNIVLTHEEVITAYGKLTALQYATAKGALLALASESIWTEHFIRQEDL